MLKQANESGIDIMIMEIEVPCYIIYRYGGQSDVLQLKQWIGVRVLHNLPIYEEG